MRFKINENYCDGCEHHCVFGARRKKLLSWTPEYDPTVNQEPLKTYIDIDGIEQPAASKTKALAIARARINAISCTKYEHTK